MLLVKKMLLAGSKIVLPDLSGGEKWEKDTVYPAGTYRVTIRAGCAYNSTDGLNSGVGFTQDIVMTQSFIIRAYCGTSATSSSSGVNPYTGTYKRSSNLTTSKPTAGGIFGNSAAAGRIISGRTTQTTTYRPGGPNCLGDGESYGTTVHIGAGSCMHFLPVGGVFGTNYLACFHAAGPGGGHSGTTTSTRTNAACTGAGSAYGGAGGGGCAVLNVSSQYAGYAGGDGAGGTGGAGGGTSTTAGATNGSAGSGVGAGQGGPATNTSDIHLATPQGGVAYYNGTSWVTPTKTVHALQGCIKVEKIA